MKTNLLPIIIVLLFSVLYANAQLPVIKRHGRAYQMYVDGKPFLMRAGELGNSSASTAEWLRTKVWQQLVDANINTALVPVYWDLIEPEEDKFDFSLVDSVIAGAKAHNMKVVFLWFGAWKNSMSCYAPSWVKRDTKRFARTEDSEGRKQEILTPYSAENLKADKKAFVALMSHIKYHDPNFTVIMIQVENEIAMLPTPRDCSKLATQVWKSTVPTTLTEYLREHHATLTPHLQKYWNGKTAGTWSELFGDDEYAQEIFTAWSFAAYANEIAKAGRAVHKLPMYVNCALNRPNKKPGEYPAGGPLPHLIDVWKAGAPAIQMLSPDIYFGDFVNWTKPYRRADNPFFIPEHQYDASAGAKALYTFGEYHGLGFSPFAVETRQANFTPPVLGVTIDIEAEKQKHNKSVTIPLAYNIIKCIEEDIKEANGTSRMRAVLLDSIHNADTLVIGNYQIIARHDNLLGWTPQSKQSGWSVNSVIIINTEGDNFLVAGTGVVLTFKTLTPEKTSVGIDRIEDIATDGSGRVLRILNGDEDHQGRHVRITDGEWGIQKFSLYTY
jgi:beta-galactosidase GanA